MSCYAPEFGRTPGGQISLVTRSGTNTAHGSVFEYFRHDYMDASDWFVNNRGLDKPKLRQQGLGGVLGGPIRRSLTFFFVSYEGQRLQQPRPATVNVPSVETRQPAPLRALSTVSGRVPTPGNSTMALGLTTWIHERPAGIGGGQSPRVGATSSDLRGMLSIAEAPTVNEVGLSPDSSHVVYSVDRGSMATNQHTTDLLLLPLDALGGSPPEPLSLGNACPRRGEPRSRHTGAQTGTPWPISPLLRPVTIREGWCATNCVRSASRLSVLGQPGLDGNLAWSPDGQWIAFTSHASRRVSPSNNRHANYVF
jgi:hypothetical protein